MRGLWLPIHFRLRVSAIECSRELLYSILPHLERSGLTLHQHDTAPNQPKLTIWGATGKLLVFFTS